MLKVENFRLENNNNNMYNLTEMLKAIFRSRINGFRKVGGNRPTTNSSHFKRQICSDESHFYYKTPLSSAQVFESHYMINIISRL